LKMFKYCDLSDKVVLWNSEEVVVPYVNPLDQKVHRYFVDIYLKYKTPNGLKERIIEIKPEVFTRPPKKTGRKTRRYIIEVERYLINQAKWHAAEKWAHRNKMDFKVFTEKELGIENGKRRKF